MKSRIGATPFTTSSAYAERLQRPPSWLDEAGSRLASPFLRLARLWSLRPGAFVRKAEADGKWAESLTDIRLKQEAAEIGAQIRFKGFADPLVARCFSLVREAAVRTIGKRHFDVQLIGGRIMLNGLIAEMETGEGKTLTATLPAAAAALAGIPVHVITVNDYLAARDARWMEPIYHLLGLRVGTIVHGLDPEERRRAYGAHVTYCANKEVTFDYLKDRLVLGHQADRSALQIERLYEKKARLDRLLLRGLHYAIVDEADSVLVDEARTPLIISGADSSEESERETCEVALSLASEMTEGYHFKIDGPNHSIKFLPSGLDRLDEASADLDGVWRRRHWREQLVRQALAAQHLYIDGKQYLIRDEKIQIIDEYTGRVMPDRSWEHGLHQMIEAKEGVTMTGRTEPLARISYQRFFRRYVRLSGMTGTAREVAAELWSVYRLATVRVPTNRPSQRKRWPDQIFCTDAEKWNTIVGRISELHRKGRPVLVGTRSVKASEHLSHLLNEHNLPHQLLNARQDVTEALIVSEAGQKGRITVATNMAGRGTDIQLGPEVAALGGLHVMATELHEARRIDRQLFGRCGRQGDPGTCEAIISTQDELTRLHTPGVSKLLSRVVAPGRALSPFAGLSLRLAQRSAERLHRRMRRDLQKVDAQLETTLAFSGRPE